MEKVIEETAAQRKIICDSCEWDSENRKKSHGYTNIYRPYRHCVDCGCELDAKRKCLSCECPLKKWTAVITSEERDQLTEELNGNSTN